MLSDAFLRPVQLFLIRNKPKILQVCLAFYIVLAAAYLLGLPLFIVMPDLLGIMLDVGNKFGVLALILYGFTLLPGILKRLQILPVTQVTLMLFRRQFGILMFLTVLIHSGYSLLFPLLSTSTLSINLFTTREVLGTIAEIVLFPLFITSNDRSVRVLGKWWNRVHKLTYVALLFIFGHVVLLGGELHLKLFIGSLLVLEFISWGVWLKRKGTPAAVTSSSQTITPPPTIPPPILR
ncbi:ferric reductase-like transmembrane domain-containing protein [Candidatus Woesebacteria bacterium]|nr:ferric reductase-like transmembrane domain-containing protein [Candidatus Woesebacteria bacterium]